MDPEHWFLDLNALQYECLMVLIDAPLDETEQYLYDMTIAYNDKKHWLPVGEGRYALSNEAWAVLTNE